MSRSVSAMEKKAHKVVNKVFNHEEYNKAIFEDKYDLLVLHVFNSDLFLCCPAILLLARRFPDVSFCIADAKGDKMLCTEPTFVLYDSNRTKVSYIEQGVDDLQVFVTNLSKVVESFGFRTENSVENFGVIDVSKYTADRKDEKKKLKNVFHHRGAGFLENIVKHNFGFALNFEFDSSLGISGNYIEVIDTLAEKHPEIIFFSTDVKGRDKNPYSSSGLFRLRIDAYYNNTSIAKKIHSKLHTNLYGFSDFLSSYHKEAIERNFVFASSGKEAASVVSSNPAVLAFVYDKDDEEHICSEGVLFNNVHDMSLLFPRVVYLLVEKTVANSKESPKELYYVNTPTCTAYLNGSKLISVNERFESLERAIASIKEKVQIKEKIRQLKNLYRGNFLLYLI